MCLGGWRTASRKKKMCLGHGEVVGVVGKRGWGSIGKERADGGVP